MKLNNVILFFIFLFCFNSEAFGNLRSKDYSRGLLEYEFKQNLFEAYHKLNLNLTSEEILTLTKEELAKNINYKFMLGIKEKYIFADIMQKMKKVESDGLHLDSIIGTGTSKLVFKVVEEQSEYALLLYLDIEKKEESFNRELKVLQNYPHPNIIKLIDYNKENFLILEEFAECDLFELLMNNCLGVSGGLRLSFEDKINFVKDIVKAIKHLHKNKIIFRDLKPENVLLVRDPVSGYKAKLTDFSFAQKLKESDSILKETVLQGSFYYLSPESIRYFNCKTKKTNACLADDIFALGVVIFEIFCWGHMDSFYKNEYKLYKRKQKGLQTKPKSFMFFVFDKVELRNMPGLTFLNIHEKLKEIIKKCWQPLKKRPKISEIYDILYNNF